MVYYHEEHEGHEEWNLMNYLNELLDVHVNDELILELKSVEEIKIKRFVI